MFAAAGAACSDIEHWLHRTHRHFPAVEVVQRLGFYGHWKCHVSSCLATADRFLRIGPTY